MFLLCRFSFVFGEGCDSVWSSEGVVGWIVINGRVPFFWCEFIPVVDGSLSDAFADF